MNNDIIDRITATAANARICRNIDMQENARLNRILYGHTPKRSLHDVKGVIWAKTKPNENIRDLIRDFNEADRLSLVSTDKLLRFYRAMRLYSNDRQHITFDYVDRMLRSIFGITANMLNPFLTLDISWAIGTIQDQADYDRRKEELKQRLTDALENPHVRAEPLDERLTVLCRRWVEENHHELTDELCGKFLNWRYHLARTLATILEDRCTTLAAQRPIDARLGAVSSLDFVKRHRRELTDTPSLYSMTVTIGNLLDWKKHFHEKLPPRTWFLQLAINLQMTTQQADDLLYYAGYLPLYDRRTGKLLTNDPESAVVGTFLRWAESLPLEETGYTIRRVTAAGFGTTILRYPGFRYLANKDRLNSLIWPQNPLDRYQAFPFANRVLSKNNRKHEPMFALLVCACGVIEQQPNGTFRMHFHWSQHFPDLKQLVLFTRNNTARYEARLSRVQLLLNRYSGGTPQTCTFPFPDEPDFKNRVQALRKTIEDLPPEPKNPYGLGLEAINPQLNGYLLCVSLLRLFTTGHFLSKREITPNLLSTAYDSLEQHYGTSDINEFSDFADTLITALF